MWVNIPVHPTMAALPLLRQTQQVSLPSLSKFGQSLFSRPLACLTPPYKTRPYLARRPASLRSIGPND